MILLKIKSVQRIKLANFHSKSGLIFFNITESKVMNEISNLSSKKTTGNGHIPPKILKKRNNIITHCMKKGIFLDNLKLSDKATTLKRRWFNFNKENYRTINILTDMSKVIQRIFYKEIDISEP